MKTSKIKYRITVVFGLLSIIVILIAIPIGIIKTNTNNYISTLTNYPDSLVDHFPIIGNLIVKDFIFSKSFMKVEFKLSKKLLRNIKNNSKIQAKAKYQDPNIFVIRRKLVRNIEFIPNTDQQDIPISDMTHYNRTDLDFIYWEHFIFEVSNKKVLSNDLLFTKNNVLINWKNGYSKGVSINEESKKIVYWLEIW